MSIFTLRLVPGWRRVMRRSISMWAAYLSLAILVAPEIMFLFGIETSPYVAWVLALVVVVGGNIVGRIIDQGGLDRG